MRVVLDTHVLIASFISPKGICHEVFELCSRNHTLLSSDFILAELKHKFYYNGKEIKEVIDIILLKFEIIKIKTIEINICRDNDDNNILETAVSSKANALITGD